MKTHFIALVAAVGLALAVAFLLRTQADANEAHDSVSAIAGHNDQGRAEILKLESRLLEIRGSLAAAHRPIGSRRDVDVASKPDTGSVSPARESGSNLPAIFAANSSNRARYLANFRAQLDLSYGGMFRALRLSPEQIEKFKDLEVALHEEGKDLQAVIDSQHLNRNGPEARKLWDEYFQSRAQKKTELFGPLAERYLEYFHTAGVREQVQRLAAPDLVPGQTVTADQVERATDILIANSRRKSGEAHGVERGTVDWPSARTQLAGILSPAQIEWLGLFVDEEKASAQVGELQRRLTAEFRSKARGK